LVLRTVGPSTHSAFQLSGREFASDPTARGAYSAHADTVELYLTEPPRGWGEGREMEGKG